MLSLPTEVFDHMAGFLSQHDFALLTRVCKEWHPIWTRHLWRSIQARHEDCLDHFSATSAINNRLKHGQYIRELHVCNIYTAREIMLDTTIRLHTLDLLDTSRTLGLYSSHSNELIHILKQSPTLVTLKLAECPRKYELFLYTVIEHLPRLKIFDVLDAEMAHIPKLMDITVKTFLANCPSTLEYIQMAVLFTGSNQEEVNEQPWLAKYYDKTIDHPALTIVSFNGHMGERIPLILSEDFVRSAPRLKAIEFLNENVPLTNWVTTGALQSTIQQASSRFLKMLTPSHAWESSDQDLAQYISTGQGNRGDSVDIWYSLDLAGIKAVGPATCRAILNTCREDLTELNLSGCCNIASQDLQAILSSIVHLRSLEANCISDYIEGCPKLLAQDMFLSTWTCRWLRTLSIEIGGIPRPDIQEDQHGRPIPEGHPMHSGTVEESYAIQQRVYRQLGRLVYLEELYLGNNQGEHQLNCLSMTLESGLELMDGLQALRVIGVGRMHHQIDKVDQDWMWRTWCRLETILGV